MQVPFTLRPLPHALPAAGLLVPSLRPEEPLRILQALALDPLPPLYRLADGYLIALPKETTQPCPGWLRLRRLADHLWLPVDAELIPALLAEEAAGLVSKRGLVFLPGLRVLEYDRGQQVPLSALVQAPPVQRAGWEELPTPPALPDHVEEISLEQPMIAPEDLLDQGGAGIGEDEPRPKDAGLGAKMLGGTLMGLGKGLGWLGKGLGFAGLAGLGAKMMAGALNLAPRLSEKLMGQQEAALRDLLKDFRAGNIDQALRRALPLGGDTGRGAEVHQGTELPRHNLFFSLTNLLGSRGSGAGGVWFTRDDVYGELLKEYRKQAELAAQLGDFRRAAFIHAKLLSDFRAAAAVLARGGLHREAAILYWKKLNDPRAAAQEFAAAGEVDRAVHMFHLVGDHVAAGDLLRQAGEEERALAEYQQAASHMIAAGQGHYQAGELLRGKVPQKPELALHYYREGWAARPKDSPVPCAVRLVQHHAQQKDVRDLLVVVQEAEDYLALPFPEEQAASFFNEVAVLAHQPGLETCADDLRDRALMGLAGKLRQGPKGPAAVNLLFPASSPWAAPLVHDARHAAARQPAARLPQGPILVYLRGENATITAAAFSSALGALFIGYEHGEVIRYQPQTGAVDSLYRERGPVASLTLSDQGEVLVVTHRTDLGQIQISVLPAAIGFRMRANAIFPGHINSCASVNTTGEQEMAFWDGLRWEFLRLPELTPIFSQASTGPILLPPTFAEDSDDVLATPDLDHPWACFLNTNDHRSALLTLEHQALKLYSLPTRSALSTTLDTDVGFALWTENTLRSQHLACLQTGPQEMLLAGINKMGQVRSLRVQLRERTVAATHHNLPNMDYAPVVAWVGPERLAAVTFNAIHWFAPDAIKPRSITKTTLPRAVACFYYQRAEELLVLCRNGDLARVPVPR